MASGTSWRNVEAQCPFYVMDTSGSISCEGLVDGASIRQTFRSKTDCTIQFDTFCAEHYRFCELYQAIKAAKYQDD